MLIFHFTVSAGKFFNWTFDITFGLPIKNSDQIFAPTDKIDNRITFEL